MTALEKQKKLIACNDLPIEAIAKIIKEGDITLDEFINNGLDKHKILEINELIVVKNKLEKDEQNQQQNAQQKQDILDKIKTKKISAFEIQGFINNRIINFDDLESIGLSRKTVNSIKHYCSTDRITQSYTISTLPKMEEGRTDLYFVGLPGSGKSTMIAAFLKVAHELGVSLADPYNPAGMNFQSNLIQDLNRGVLPKETDKGSYNYVAASLNDANNKRHPFNIVDVPGELYKSVLDNPEVSLFLEYINNKNKKILIFVIDAIEHENENSKELDQSVVLPNILQIFNKNKVLEQTDAIYLVVNKFDALLESRYGFVNKPKGDLALDFINSDFLGLKNNCIASREDTRTETIIKVLPFSVGSVSYNSILENFDNEFAKTFLNQIIKDSFVISGGKSKFI